MPSPLVKAAALAAILLAHPAATSAAPAPAAAAAKRGAASAAHGPVLPWIVDDLPRAIAEAKARKLPLFVESWAPW